MADTSDTSLRSKWASLEPQTKAAVFSILIALVFIFATKGGNGDFIGNYTDHIHHAHITWAGLHVGTKIWTMPWRDAAAISPAYPHPSVTWEQFPNPYPPGMSVVFLLPALVGKYVTMERQTFGKLIIFYLMLIMTAANWHLAAFMRRLKSPGWTALLVFVWIFNIRASLMGFYDGAWLLAGLLCVRALEQKKYAPSLLWFVACAFINYRAIGFLPFGLLAFWGFVRGGDPPWKKLVVLAVTGVAALMVVTTFYWMMKNGPKEHTAGADSPLLPLKVRGYSLLAIGFALAAWLWRSTSKLTAVTLGLATVFCVVHGGHSWHGLLAFPPLVALSISDKRPPWAQIAIAVWMLLMLRFTMFFEPWNWVEEIYVFIERDGAIVK